MTRRRRAPAGFTLIELILAVGLSTIVMLGLAYLIVPLVREEVLAAHGQTVELGLASALKTADLAISQASWLQSPSQPGVAASALEGCVNASAPSGGEPAAPLDASRPMSWFAVCPADGRLYYHQGEGCPPRYVCGSAPFASFGGGSAPQSQASFTRASPYTTVVEISLGLTSGGASESLQSAAAYAGAAGTTQ